MHRSVWLVGGALVLVLLASLLTLFIRVTGTAVLEAAYPEHVVACEGLERVHGAAPSAAALEGVGPVPVPNFDGVEDLRAVVVPADPNRPRQWDVVPGGRPPDTLTRPDPHRDTLVFVGRIGAVDEFADQLEASADRVVDRTRLPIPGALQRTLAFERAGARYAVSLTTCGRNHWLHSRPRIDPAHTGACAAAGQQAACRQVLDWLDRIEEEVQGDLSNRSALRPQVDPSGRVSMTLDFELELGSQFKGIDRLVHEPMTATGWDPVDRPGCPADIDFGEAAGMFCDAPRDPDLLRRPGGLAYTIGADGVAGTAAWTAVDGTPDRLRLVLTRA